MCLEIMDSCTILSLTGNNLSNEFIGADHQLNDNHNLILGEDN